MSSNKDGIIIILSSPSGAGKTTLVKKISKIANFHTSISYTTRIPRINELDGKDYFFIKEIEFNTLIKNNELLEYAKVFNNFYGSSKKKVLNKLNEGMNVIFDIDWQGTQQIKEQELNYKLLTFFILPPSKKILLSRLAERENNNEKVIKERMEKFDQDVLHWKDYDYVIINNDLEVCYKQISEYIDCEVSNQKSNYDIDLIKNHINKLTS